MKVIGEKIREKRVQKGWSQEELAQKVGVSKMLVSQIERGLRTLTMPVAIEMATAFGCTLDELSGRA